MFAIDASGPASIPADAFKFLPAAGYRNYNNGSANMNNNNRVNGYSVRCVQASGNPCVSILLLKAVLEEDMYRAYIDARHHKRGTRAQTIFEMHLEDNLTRLSEELRDGSYRPGRSMCFIINDPVKREVFAASFRDRVVHHLLYKYIAPVLDRKFIHDSYSCRVGKGILEGIRRLEHHIRS